MKRISILLVLLFAGNILSAQTVEEKTVSIGKKDVTGYVLTCSSTDLNLVKNALTNYFENDNKLKPSKEKSYTVYKNQTFSAFGPENFDIYTLVEEVGKKNAKNVQVTVVVSSGNYNAISSKTNAQSADKIKSLLQNFDSYVYQYEIKNKLANLESQLEKLNATKKTQQASEEKIKTKLTELNKELETLKTEQSKTDEAILDVQRQINALRQ
ncbi:MAG: hypothetical protein IJM12_04955 [Bacteroidales bacterium]|nr:hypothetical protein [Bacteroidales bacterium]